MIFFITSGQCIYDPCDILHRKLMLQCLVTNLNSHLDYQKRYKIKFRLDLTVPTQY